MHISRQQKEDAEQLKEDMIIECTAHCFVCGSQFPQSELQMAHVIPKHINYLKRFGYGIINHRLNLRITCSSCNSSVMVHPDTIPGKQLIEEIKQDIINKS